MKTWIHPQVHDCKVTCTCGAKFTIKSTAPELKVETCNQCHSHYTWKKRDDSQAWRVAKFRERQEAANKAKEAKKED